MTSKPPLSPGCPGPGLALIGYRGTGKSTAGRILADRLNRKFLDADLEIEARAGRSIGSIFTEWGEAVFRDWEEQTLAELTSKFPDAIVATGGGAVLRESNRRRIRELGFIVWLRAEPSVLARRLESDRCARVERPPLTPAGVLAEIATVLEVRMPIYLELADAVLETGDKTPEEVAGEILGHWEGWRLALGQK
jgi:shikimate kinase